MQEASIQSGLRAHSPAADHRSQSEVAAAVAAAAVAAMAEVEEVAPDFQRSTSCRTTSFG